MDLWPECDVRTPYGMTEWLPVADIDLVSLESLGPDALHHLGVCVGSPVDGVELLIDPLDELGVPTGRPTTEPGALGEILIRCNNVMYMRQAPAGGLAAMEE